MMFKQGIDYTVVPNHDGDDESNLNGRNEFSKEQDRPWIESTHLIRSKGSCFALLGLISAFSCLLTVGIMVVVVNMDGSGIDLAMNTLRGRCTNPPIRREWRTLLESEKQEYIRAVKCLNTLPSVIMDAGTVWDDFDWVHEKMGQDSHQSGSFLPWHRMFLHTYETYLKRDCHYNGQMPYWDWGLDWQNLGNSSIWNNTNGFGGAGQGPLGVSQGHCVTDGPFKDIHLRYYNQSVQPHCLSRTFQHYEKNKTGEISGVQFKPEMIGWVRRSESYVDLVDRIEGIGHNAMHWAIKGDFSQFSATNDPVFFLHHTQLDRMWWLWQQDDPRRRLQAYGGKAFKHTNSTGSLRDKISTMGLAPGIRVSQVMQTEGDFLCYRY